MNKKTLIWLGMILMMVIGSLIAMLVIQHTHATHRIATVTVDQEVVRTIQLDDVTTPYQFRVETAVGYNTIEVRPGAIEIIEADCPDQICVHQGAIDDGIEPIVCLPHKLVIRIQDPKTGYTETITNENTAHDHEKGESHEHEKSDVVSK